jgi:CheY-like chemotaxis protein
MMKKLNCVMLIDDNEDDNFYHKMIIREVDLAKNVEVAETGFEALDLLKKGTHIPELIFLDINMPAMNGWEFLEEYKKLKAEQKAQIVIIMLTTSLNPADKKRAEKIPEIDGFETKPLSAEMLERIFKKFFSKTEG